MQFQPYITFVVVARNDNYGGDFLCRINTFTKNIINLCEKHCLPSELVVVEWNPPQDRPPIKNDISWPDIERKYCTIRIIEVPNEVHKRIPNPEKMHLFEYIGKNVGVRRARGEYILTTNPDTLFSDELIEFLAMRKLSRKCFYRIDRHDVKMPIPVETVENQLRYCQENVIRIYGYFWSYYDRKTSGRYWRLRQARSLVGYLNSRIRIFPFAPLHSSASGDFLLMHRDRWQIMRGFAELETQGNSQHIDSLAVRMAQLSGLRQIILKYPLRLYHQDHNRPDPDRLMSPAVREAFEELRKARNLRELVTFNNKWGLEEESLTELGV